MKIKKITWQLRRDFTAIFECEHCGFEEKRDGYDDAFFHRNVIPSMKCDQCGKTAGDDYRPLGDDQGPCIYHFISSLGLLRRVG